MYRGVVAVSLLVVQKFESYDKFVVLINHNIMEE